MTTDLNDKDIRKNFNLSRDHIDGLNTDDAKRKLFDIMDLAQNYRIPNPHPKSNRWKHYFPTALAIFSSILFILVRIASIIQKNASPESGVNKINAETVYSEVIVIVSTLITSLIVYRENHLKKMELASRNKIKEFLVWED
ncbi:hypothetical protein BB558_006030 [Smittium angustum]|uniref:Uncharacterized protein n=1 Tax=Smittium angustum TaxID=133377 RepID=A0A2U1IYU0_SMIAN|nr:hypothetical protein BB558_006030 [Smittium angustum]